jgi:hypothetical protein
MIKKMNIKRIFGAILTVIGIVGLISTASLFLITARGNSDIKILVIYGFFGLLFFYYLHQVGEHEKGRILT